MLRQKQRSLVLDNTYLEKAIFGLFQISISNLITNKVQLAKNFHIQPSEIDNMTMWEYELFMKELNEIVKKENKEQTDEINKYDIKGMRRMTNPNNISKMTNSKLPSNISSIKMPSINGMKFK